MRSAARIGGLAGALAAVAVTGCGIRPTSVPVDAGGAPSRAACAPGGPTLSAAAAEGEEPYEVYLVCGSQLSPVGRGVPRDVSGAGLAAALLAELTREPGRIERHAGYSTAVSGLRVEERRPGDPEGTVRLSRNPRGLGTPELAQIVCTYAALGSGTALLAGPGADSRPYRYHCTDDTLRNPESVPAQPAA